MAAVLVLSAMAHGQDTSTTNAPTATSPGAPATADGLAQWQHWPDSDIHPSDGVVFGVAVDRTTGDLFTVHKNSPNTWGGPAEIYKSTDQARTFTKATNTIIGSSLSAYHYNFDSTGKRIAFFLVGSPASGGMSIDGGVTWTPFGVDPKKRGFEGGVVDWDDTGKTCLAVCHESPTVALSHDAGVTWQELDGFTSPVGIFDSKTLIVGNATDHSLQRSTDGGATWTKVGDAPVTIRKIESIVTFNGVGYLITPQGLLASKDKGATWQPYGKPVNISGTQNKFRPQGPFFGADEKHIVLAGTDGVFQTEDGGEHWIKVASFPAEVSAHKPAFEESFARDPVHNIIYACVRQVPALYCQIPVRSAP
jgi:photosystem II stability/assembly factor-like uncharacterized protein